ncbi:hypothetical protein QTI17_17235 [Variovorax sp. J31P179]|nr:hypothetical protein [Variovorax sp. J31P179]
MTLEQHRRLGHIVRLLSDLGHVLSLPIPHNDLVLVVATRLEVRMFGEHGTYYRTGNSVMEPGGGENYIGGDGGPEFDAICKRATSWQKAPRCRWQWRLADEDRAALVAMCSEATAMLRGAGYDPKWTQRALRIFHDIKEATP